MVDRNLGIASLGLALPPLVMELSELARLRGVDPAKYELGLGCRSMALCPRGYGVIDLATTAAKRALRHWGGEQSEIGLLAVGTESAVDMSRPLSAFVAERLGLSGAIRSYEVKHACYSGTLALRQALEWKLSGAGKDRAALVIAADVALYAPGDPGEPTQGAGASAMIVDDARIAAIATESHAWSEPAFDFWRPVGEPFPRVDGPLSLDCYRRAVQQCFTALAGSGTTRAMLERLSAVCFHVPFPKMVQKSMGHLGEVLGWPVEYVERVFREKVEPTMAWNRLCGNAYSASLWISVASTLRGLAEGRRIAAFSYGSGFGSELLVLHAGPLAAAGAWAADIEDDLARRRPIDTREYESLRAEH